MATKSTGALKGHQDQVRVPGRVHAAVGNFSIIAWHKFDLEFSELSAKLMFPSSFSDFYPLRLGLEVPSPISNSDFNELFGGHARYCSRCKKSFFLNTHKCTCGGDLILLSNIPTCRLTYRGGIMSTALSHLYGQSPYRFNFGGLLMTPKLHVTARIDWPLRAPSFANKFTVGISIIGDLARSSRNG